MSRQRPWAVERYRDGFDVLLAARQGRLVEEGYYTLRPRYTTREAAQAAADYANLFDHPETPAIVVDLRPRSGLS